MLHQAQRWLSVCINSKDSNQPVNSCSLLTLSEHATFVQCLPIVVQMSVTHGQDWVDIVDAFCAHWAAFSFPMGLSQSLWEKRLTWLNGYADVFAICSVMSPLFVCWSSSAWVNCTCSGWIVHMQCACSSRQNLIHEQRWSEQPVSTPF